MGLKEAEEANGYLLELTTGVWAGERKVTSHEASKQAVRRIRQCHLFHERPSSWKCPLKRQIHNANVLINLCEPLKATFCTRNWTFSIVYP